MFFFKFFISGSKRTNRIMAEQSSPRQDKLSLVEQLQNMHLGAPPAISNGVTNIPTQEPGLLRLVDSLILLYFNTYSNILS